MCTFQFYAYIDAGVWAPFVGWTKYRYTFGPNYDYSIPGPGRHMLLPTDGTIQITRYSAAMANTWFLPQQEHLTLHTVAPNGTMPMWI